MNMDYLAIYLIGAVTTLVFAWGATVAHFQGRFPMLAEKDYRQDLGFGLVMALLIAAMWPVGIILVLALTGFLQHGWRLTPSRDR